MSRGVAAAQMVTNTAPTFNDQLNSKKSEQISSLFVFIFVRSTFVNSIMSNENWLKSKWLTSELIRLFIFDSRRFNEYGIRCSNFFVRFYFFLQLGKCRYSVGTRNLSLSEINLEWHISSPFDCSVRIHFSIRNDRIRGDALIFVIYVDSERHKFHTSMAFLRYVFACALSTDNLGRTQLDKLCIYMDVRQYVAWKGIGFQWNATEDVYKVSDLHHMNSQSILDWKTPIANHTNVGLDERMSFLVHRQIVEFMECFK